MKIPEQIETYIAENRLDEALVLLRQESTGKPQYQMVLMLQNQWRSVEEQRIKNTLSFAEIEQNKARIIDSILSLLNLILECPSPKSSFIWDRSIKLMAQDIVRSVLNLNGKMRWRSNITDVSINNHQLIGEKVWVEGTFKADILYFFHYKGHFKGILLLQKNGVAAEFIEFSNFVDRNWTEVYPEAIKQANQEKRP